MSTNTMFFSFISFGGKFILCLFSFLAVSELQKLGGQTLISKDGREVIVTSVSLTPPELKIQTPDDASLNLPPSMSEPQAVCTV